MSLVTKQDDEKVDKQNTFMDIIMILDCAISWSKP